MDCWKLKNIGIAIFLLFFLMVANIVSARASCENSPSCESLGYVMTMQECSGPALRCPFDNSKVYCNTRTILPATCEDIARLSKQPLGQHCVVEQMMLQTGLTDCYNYCRS